MLLKMKSECFGYNMGVFWQEVRDFGVFYRALDEAFISRVLSSRVSFGPPNPRNHKSGQPPKIVRISKIVISQAND